MPSRNSKDNDYYAKRFHTPLAKRDHSKTVLYPSGPDPVLTWDVAYPNGANIVDDLTDGTVLGTLAGASTYSIVGPSMLKMVGNELQVNDALLAGPLSFCIEGKDVHGVPGLTAEISVIVAAA